MASGRSPPPEIGEEDQEVVEVEVGTEGKEEEEDAFDIPSKNVSHDRLRRWRQAALVLNASRRFRYTLDLQMEEDRENLRRTIRAHAQVIRAVFLFKEAGQKELGEACTGINFEPLSQRFPIDLEKLIMLNRDHEAISFQEVGGVRGLSDLLKSNLDRGVCSNEDELVQRRDIFGANTYPRKKRRSIWRFVFEACQDLTLVILMVAAAISLSLGMATEGVKNGWYDGGSILFAVFLVIFVTATSDYRQSLQFQHLNEEKQNIQVEVIRDGKRIGASIFDLVVGDVVPLKIGDQVPADGVLISGHSLAIDESSMTGESKIVHKDQKAPFLMSGCKVADGYGSMLVTGVGTNTEWGMLMANLSEDIGEETPLQVRLNGVATLIGILGLSVAGAVLVVLWIRYFTGHAKNPDGATQFVAGTTGVKQGFMGAIRIFTIAVTIVVVAVPEGLPLAVTLTLAYSMGKMMQDKALVRRLSSCETMGSATTICSDKTGTLTLNKMTVVEAYLGGTKLDPCDITGMICSSVTDLLIEGIAQNTTGAVFLPEDGGAAEVTGSPTENAILSWGLKIGMNFNDVRSKSSVLHVHPFNSVKKRGGVAVQSDDYVHIHWKGAAELLLASCKTWLSIDGSVQQMSSDKQNKFKRSIDDMAMSSLRCITFAYCPWEFNMVPREGLDKWQLPEDNLTLIGIVGIKTQGVAASCWLLQPCRLALWLCGSSLTKRRNGMADKKRKLSQAGMRRFLVDTKNQHADPGLGGSQETQRNSNRDEPREVPVPDHPETERNLGNVVTEFNPNEILCDPALRKQINEYAPEIQEQVRRAYILKGPTQPTNLVFPRTNYGSSSSRAFSRSWYKKYSWLEYSESKDAGFCFYCFLFKEPGRPEHFGYDVFSKTGWRDWKHAYKSLPDHVGGVGSAHNNCVKKCDDFKNQRQSVLNVFHKASQRSEELYQIRLASTLRCSRYLLKQGMAFRGHDESSSSLNKGNLLELVDFLKDNNDEVRDAYDRGGLNCKMTSHKVQKDLARSCAEEITEKIMAEIGDRNFSVLIDESRDISVKEQMAIIIRYVNSQGNVVERFLALVHVSDTTSGALKEALFGVLDRHKLSISRIRGQGYDGASNMRGEFNGLQKKILDENPYAFYVHCFAHQLQLVVVSTANCCSSVHDFFEYVSLIVMTTSASCKRRDALIESHHQNILDRLINGEASTGRGLNQETILARPGDTRWGSHHTTLVRLSQMWDSVIEVLRMVHEDARAPTQAAGLIEKMECFQFVFILKLMLRLLGITNELSHLLQRKDINIVNALELVHDVKARLNTMRESGWDDLFDEVRQFCELKGIPIPNMSEEIPVRGRSRRDGFTITNLHYYRAEIFYIVVDKICAEMNHRFAEATTELLMCFSCLDPKNSFSKFDVDKLARLAEIYVEDFSDHDRGIIREQLKNYITHVRRHAAFGSCTDIASLATKMVETEKHLFFPLVYKLIELALLLPVSTATVERCFSAMKIIKSKLRNKIADDWFNNLMVCYIERELFRSLDEAAILRRFQNIKKRKNAAASCS